MSAVTWCVGEERESTTTMDVWNMVSSYFLLQSISLPLILHIFYKDKRRNRRHLKYNKISTCQSASFPRTVGSPWLRLGVSPQKCNSRRMCTHHTRGWVTQNIIHRAKCRGDGQMGRCWGLGHRRCWHSAAETEEVWSKHNSSWGQRKEEPSSFFLLPLLVKTTTRVAAGRFTGL